MDDLQKKLWRERAHIGGIQGSIDPADTKGLKNCFIDTAQKIILSKELAILQTDKVLDYGCGSGRISSWIADHGVKEIVGIDTSPEMIEEAKRFSPPRSNLAFKSYDASRIPFKEGYFDKVLSITVMQHILDKTAFQNLIQELYRVLAPNGKAILIEHVMRKSTLEKYPETDQFYKILRSPEEYVSSFEEAGFKLLTQKAITSMRYGLIYKLIALKMLPAFARPLIPSFVSLDLMFTSGKGIPESGYLDCLFIFER